MGRYPTEASISERKTIEFKKMNSTKIYESTSGTFQMNSAPDLSPVTIIFPQGLNEHVKMGDACPYPAQITVPV